MTNLITQHPDPPDYPDFSSCSSRYGENIRLSDCIFALNSIPGYPSDTIVVGGSGRYGFPSTKTRGVWHTARLGSGRKILTISQELARLH